jgi:hypothetical protein
MIDSFILLTADCVSLQIKKSPTYSSTRTVVGLIRDTTNGQTRVKSVSTDADLKHTTGTCILIQLYA